MNMYRGDESDLQPQTRTGSQFIPAVVPTPRFNRYMELLGRVGTALMTTLMCVVIFAVILLIVLLGVWAIVEVARWL